MNLVGMLSVAVLSLALSAAAPAYAQQEQRDQPQEEQKGKSAPEAKKAQPEKNAQPEKKAPENKAQPEKNAQSEKPTGQQKKNTQADQNSSRQQKRAPQQQAPPQHAQQSKGSEPQQRAGNNRGGRIPDDRFQANFGREHTFRVSRGDYDNRRFQYGGYSFGIVEAWPSNWLYTQDVYVVDINGVYYLCNPVYPGVTIALSFTL